MQLNRVLKFWSKLNRDLSRNSLRTGLGKKFKGQNVTLRKQNSLAVQRTVDRKKKAVD